MQNTFNNITHQQAFIWYITPNKKYKLNTHAIANISHNIHSISPLIFMLLFTVLEGHTIQYNISNKPHEERKKIKHQPHCSHGSHAKISEANDLPVLVPVVSFPPFPKTNSGPIADTSMLFISIPCI